MSERIVKEIGLFLKYLKVRKSCKCVTCNRVTKRHIDDYYYWCPFYKTFVGAPLVGYLDGLVQLTESYCGFNDNKGYSPQRLLNGYREFKKVTSEINRVRAVNGNK